MGIKKDFGQTKKEEMLLRHVYLFAFFREDELGHIAIEVFAELDDGGDYSKHNCCFFVRTEYGLLMNFCDHLVQLKNGSVGCEIRLNCF